MTDVSWSIEVELDEKDIHGFLIDDLMNSLEGAGPAIAQAPSGNLSIRIMVDAPTAYQAFDLGTARVREAARGSGSVDTVVGVHLEIEAGLDRRLNKGSSA